MNGSAEHMDMLAGSVGLIVPELLLVVGAMVFLMAGAFKGDKWARTISWASILLLLVSAAVVYAMPSETQTAFNGALVIDGFAKYTKILVLIGSAATIAMMMNYVEQEKLNRFELPILILIATSGMLFMISANDLISLYIGLEMQSLPLYVLAAFNRDSLRSSEAGLKYFVLGALSSGLLLYGASLIYGAAGTTQFEGLAAADLTHTGRALFLAGLAFLMAGLAFKISAAPFHMWTPDVYEGAPTPVTAFFAGAPKVAAMALLVRTLVEPFPDASAEWRQIIVLLAVLSMVVGAFAAIGQSNIKRLMAYSSIGHMGFALVGLAAGTADGVKAVLIYMTIYMATNLGAFVCILSMRRKEGMVEQIEDLSGLSKNQPVMAFILAMLMFSLAGIPPLAGFFGKFYVFLAAVDAGLVWLAVVGLLTSVVGAFYYLRIIKVMYFDEAETPFVTPMPVEMRSVLAASGAFTLLFVVFAAPIIALADSAARALFP